MGCKESNQTNNIVAKIGFQKITLALVIICTCAHLMKKMCLKNLVEVTAPHFHKIFDTHFCRHSVSLVHLSKQYSISFIR